MLVLDLLLPDWCFFVLLSLPSRLRCWPILVFVDADADADADPELFADDDVEPTDDSDDMEIIDIVDEAEVSVARCIGFVDGRVVVVAVDAGDAVRAL